MLTLEEIENISFRRAGFSGYKIEDVDNFVDDVIEKVRDLENSSREYENRIEQLNQQINRYEARAESVQDAIITAEMTAKRIVGDAEEKSAAMLKEAEEKSGTMVKEAEEKSYTTVSDAEIRAQTILDNALSRSAGSIDENNRIIEQQKRDIIRIQSEVTRFREALIDSYKNHLKIINSLPKAEEFEQYQTKLEENYPPAEPVTPESAEQALKEDADKAVEEAKKEKPQIRVEMVDAEKVREISEEIRTNSKAQAELEKDLKKETDASAHADKTKDAEAPEDVSQDEKPEEQEPEADKSEDEKPESVELEDEPEEKTGDKDSSDAVIIDISSIGNVGFADSVSFSEIEDKPEADTKEAPDSNAEEIKAAANEDNSMKIKEDEPKPASIDEIDDGVIFNTVPDENGSKEKKNNRQPIRQGRKKKNGKRR